MIRPSVHRVRAALLVATAVALSACDSPEADRARGGARGADVNNRNPVVEIHAGSRMYYDTPCLLPDDECTGPPPVSGLPDHFPDQKRARS
jgi:hypothetical protein